VLAIDSAKSRQRVPNAEELILRAGFEKYVSFQYVEKSYNWAFINILENLSNARFDLINVDGARTWYSMGFAAMIATRLLNPGGWLILNGANFSYASSPRKNEKWVRKLPLIERTTMQVDKVFDLLVSGDKSFSNCRAYGTMYFAQRADDSASSPRKFDQAHIDSTICSVLARAYTDPDFRFNLIWNYEAATNSLPGRQGQLLKEVRFREGSDAVVVGKEFSSVDGCYHLPPPVWRSKMNRVALLKYLEKPNEIQQPPTVPGNADDAEFSQEWGDV
jgi:hypothetical protein